MASLCVFRLQNHYTDSAIEDLVVPFDPRMTPFEDIQWSFNLHQDIVLTMVQVQRLRNAVHTKKNKKRAIRRMWTKPFYAQRGLMGVFCCVLDEFHKVHYAEKHFIERHFHSVQTQ